MGHCYQYVRFLNNAPSHQARKSSGNRNFKYNGHFQPIISPFPVLWPEELVWTNDEHIVEYTIGAYDDELHDFNRIGDIYYND